MTLFCPLKLTLSSVWVYSGGEECKNGDFARLFRSLFTKLGMLQHSRQGCSELTVHIYYLTSPCSQLQLCYIVWYWSYNCYVQGSIHIGHGALYPPGGIKLYSLMAVDLA